MYRRFSRYCIWVFCDHVYFAIVEYNIVGFLGFYGSAWMVCCCLVVGQIIMSHSEFCNNDYLEEISSEHTCNGEYVTRWCSNCGAIVVDLDFDGRVSPGAGMKMRFPSLLKV
jgi:hypothetical protein